MAKWPYGSLTCEGRRNLVNLGSGHEALGKSTSKAGVTVYTVSSRADACRSVVYAVLKLTAS